MVDTHADRVSHDCCVSLNELEALPMAMMLPENRKKFSSRLPFDGTDTKGMITRLVLP